jgi:hypothetical protein
MFWKEYSEFHIFQKWFTFHGMGLTSIARGMLLVSKYAVDGRLKNPVSQF